ncbi:NADP-binding Rossmann-like domain containing protein [Nitzschia inconspicua]|uniref:NADP-binding Rossmann-like domain containing protein n=1 Tax=Nitzschia inconspicua TaxID=303405 RepID=A0A9K3M6A5_9STRA|nr:NADP-binding Rossmann-like domain containing protein [Nitzschia inconspicua]
MPKVDLSDKTVLIIGGGIAGLSAAYALRKKDKNVKIQIVEPKECAEVLWASYRSPFVENVAKQSLIVLNPRNTLKCYGLRTDRPLWKMLRSSR